MRRTVHTDSRFALARPVGWAGVTTVGNALAWTGAPGTTVLAPTTGTGRPSCTVAVSPAVVDAAVAFSRMPSEVNCSV